MHHGDIDTATPYSPTEDLKNETDPLWKGCWKDVRVGFFGRLSSSEPDQVPSDVWQDHVPPGVSVSRLKQVHGATVQEGAPGCVGDGDALVTDQKGLALTVVTADCVPVLLASQRLLAAVHAGWRGLVADILTAAVARFDRGEPMVAWIGPAIGACCYEVGEDVASQVAAVSNPSVIVPRQPRPHVDLVAAAGIQLRALGVADVRAVSHCTQCEANSWWSYRQEGAAAGRNVAAIWRL